MASSPNPPNHRLYPAQQQLQAEEDDDDGEEGGYIPLPTEDGTDWEVEGGGENDDVVILEAAVAERRRVGVGGDEVSCSTILEAAAEEQLVSPSCPICMERWAPEGAHRVCCIPCGHVYGRSCLLKWARHCGKNSAKCPQCNKKFKEKQVVNLYAPLIAVANDNLEKEVSYLRVKNCSLVAENKVLLGEIHKYKMLMEQLEHSGRQENTFRGHYPADGSRHAPVICSCEPRLSPQSHVAGGRSNGYNFVLEVESEIKDARVFDTDVYHQILMILRTVPMSEGGSGQAITKISFLVPDEENVLLPPTIGVVRDLRIGSPVLHDKLALLASLGKKLSIFSMESNNIVLQYDLPGPAWSCSWDINNPFCAYAGLQNGKLLVFDIRQTAMPLMMLDTGSNGSAVHTIYSVNDSMLDSRTLYTASSAGACAWNGNPVTEPPSLIPGTENRGVCISLACDSSSADYLVASFRPKVEPSRNNMGSQLGQLSQPCSPITDQGKLGTHVLLKRTNNTSFEQCQRNFGNVPEVRMSRSAIFSVNGNNVFAHGDEASRGLCIWDIPSFKVIQHLKPHQFPILDVRYSSLSGRGLLTCISKSKYQVFACSRE